MDTNLLPISQIIKCARQAGATFGHGDPKIHLAYLTKLRLLPQTVRRKVGHKIAGCYPETVIPLIKKIEEMKEAGLTYSQIRYQLQNHNEIQETGGGIQVRKQETRIDGLPFSNFQLPVPYPESHYLNPASGLSGSSYGLAFLIVGLLLGYLLAINKIGSTDSSKPMTSDKSLMTSVSPLDENSSTMVRIITANNQSGNQPIYLIAIPKQNLYKLGQMSVNDLVKSD